MRHREVFAVLSKNRIILVLVVLPFISTLWSEDPHKTLVASVELAVTMTFGIYLSIVFCARELRDIFVVFGWTTVILGALLAIWFPSLGIDHREGLEAWQGIFGHKNSAAVCIALLFSAGLLKPTKGAVAKLLNMAFLSACIGFVVLTQSRTGWILFAAGMLFVFLIRLIQRFASREQLLVGLLVMIVTLGTTTVGVHYLPIMMSSLGKDVTLTGRTEIWNAVLHMIGTRPILGYGYQAFWDGFRGASASLQYALGWAVPHSHNGFLDVGLDLGAVGVLLVLWSLVQGIRNGLACIRAGTDRDAEWYLAILFITFASNLDERGIMVPQCLEWMMYVLACVSLADKAQRARAGLRSIREANEQNSKLGAGRRSLIAGIRGSMTYLSDGSSGESC
jgi:O-antigen ligase